jgi:hypothetical protein
MDVQSAEHVALGQHLQILHHAVVAHRLGLS